MSLRYDSLLHLAGYEHAQLITVRSHHPQVYFGEQQTLPAVRPLATAPLFPTTMCPEGIQDEKSRKLALDIVKMENEMTTHSSIPVFLPGKSDGQRSLVGYNPWGPKESDTTERLNTIVKIHIKGTTSVGPDSCCSPYIERLMTKG